MTERVGSCSGMQMRGMASATVEKLQGEIDALNETFALARDEIEMAQEDAGTTYFDESYKEAKRITEEVISKWEDILSR